MGSRFSGKKRGKIWRPRPDILEEPRDVPEGKCPCRRHQLSTPPSWNGKLCCKQPLRPFDSVTRYAHCKKCGLVYWWKPGGDNCEIVTEDGKRNLQTVLGLHLMDRR